MNFCIGIYYYFSELSFTAENVVLYIVYML